MNAAAAESEIKVEDLAALVAGLSRFLTRLSSMPPFQDAGALSLAEWSVLSLIAEKNGMGKNQLANLVGVSAPRINQITESLKAAALVSVAAVPGDPRKQVLSMTSGGAEKLNEFNARLQTVLVAGLSDRPKALRGASRLINRVLMRLVTPPKPGAPKPGKK